jgi:DNA-binding CsgD family transcriptional regulator
MVHLTPREKEIVVRLLQAEKRSAIAADLSISPETVRFHLDNVRSKIKAQSVIQVIIFFAKHPPTNGSYRKV